MKKSQSKDKKSVEKSDRLVQSLFWLCVSLLVLVPLVFSTAVYRAYVIPRYAVLMAGASLIVLLLALIVRREGPSIVQTYALKSRHIVLVCLYFFVMMLSTLFGAAPVASFFGSPYNQMGLLTRLCFLAFFVGLIVALGTSELRFMRALWAIALTGFVVATYAYIQFFGRDPFISPSQYTFGSDTESVVRVHSTLGHSNFLGNFLLYTTLLTAGLALASRGRARRVALAATALSTAAIVFSGTRGAWVGLIVGSISFIIIWYADRLTPGFQIMNRKLMVRALIVIAVIALLGLAISTNPVSRSISTRARSFVSEGFTGSGRTLLWRDALKMLPNFAIIGCGPEAFRKEFLLYKSIELARLAPRTNNESSHNSYLDAAISFGIAGAVLYVAMITSALGLIFRARRRAAKAEMKFLLTGLAAAIIGVVIHNFFIFDQMSTGFYFFAFVALAFVADRIVERTAQNEHAIAADEVSKIKSSIKSNAHSGKWRWAANAFVAAACVITLLALWQAVATVSADRAVYKAFASAKAGDFERIVKLGTPAEHAFDPAGDYDFFFAQAFTLCAESTQSMIDTENRSEDRAKQLAETRTKSLEMAITFAERSIKNTFTPDSNHLLLAYLGLLSGNKALLREHASEAVRLDPNLSNARWIMAEAFLADDDRDQAKQEAKRALDLNPFSHEARMAFRRARGRAARRKMRVDEFISYARAEVDAGKEKKAERILRRAIRKSKDRCAECHRMLASMYESNNRYELAISEWDAYLKQSPADSEEIAKRIDALKSKLIKEK